MTNPVYLYLFSIVLFLVSCSTPEPDVVEEEKISFYQVDESVVNNALTKMSLDEKLNQLFVLEVNDSSRIDTVLFGGYSYATNSIDKILAHKQFVDSQAVKSFVSLPGWDWLNSLFENASNKEALLTASDTLFSHYFSLRNQLGSFLGENMRELDFNDTVKLNRMAFLLPQFQWQSKRDSAVLIAGNYFLPINDTTPASEHQQVFNHQIKSLLDTGIVSLSLNFNALNGNSGRNYLRAHLEKELDFDGLIVSSPMYEIDSNGIFNAFHQGADLIKIKASNLAEVNAFKAHISSKIAAKELDETEIDNRIRKIITAKTWMRTNSDSISKADVIKQFKVKVKALQQEIHTNSIVLVRNEKNRLPITDLSASKPILVKYGSRSYKALYSHLDKYENIKSKRVKKGSLNPNDFSSFNKIIVAIDEEIDTTYKKDLLALSRLDSSKQLIVLNFNHSNNLLKFTHFNTVIQVYGSGNVKEHKVAQAIYGGVAIVGQLPNNIVTLTQNHGLATKKIRLGYSIPEEGGIDADSLRRIKQIAREMIYAKASPGCQVLAVRQGNVIYQEAFGHMTYRKVKPIDNDDVYDLASVTKITATTPAIMKLVEQGTIKLNDSLRKHLPDSLQKIMKRPSNFANITFRQLLLHKTGAPAGLNLLKYIQYRNDTIGRWDSYFCDVKGNGYCTQLANGFYLDDDHLDSMWIKLNYTWLNPDKSYKYSDINMNMLYMMVKSKLPENETFEGFLNSQFYGPLGLRTLGYLPKTYLDTIQHKIAPTEYDSYWRGQILQGFVHDPTAAMFGGIAGSAGLFSNTNDLAIFYQMLLNGGQYGGRRFLNRSTIANFTGNHVGSHRGLGFNKPTNSSAGYRADDCPTSAWGHTGFTGICVWVDPDNDLIFIFLSNRVYPDPSINKLNSMGIRKRMHQVFYDQILPPKAIEKDSLTIDDI